MGAFWTNGDNQRQERRNREAIIGRLQIPAYDVDNADAVTVDVKTIAPNDVVTGETTHYTAGAGIAVAIVHSITLCNNDTGTNQVSVHLVPSGGSRSAGNCIFDDVLQSGETVILEGPWFLDPSDTIRSISAAASAGEVGLRGEVTECTGAIEGVTLAVDDGDALTTSLADYYTCPASGVQHGYVPAVTVCNTSTSARTVTVEIRPSGGSQANQQNVMAQSVPAGATVILSGFALEPGDAVYAKASAASVVGFRVSAVEFATP